MEKYFVTKPPVPPKTDTASVATSSSPAVPAPSVAPVQEPSPSETPAPQVALRKIEFKTALWKGTLSNQGGALTEWTMIRFTDGEPIDPKNGGVNLISPDLVREFGASLRFSIPSDQALEKELNSANYTIDDLSSPDSDVKLELAKGEQREITFSYNHNGVVARKKYIFNGSGYDFGFQVEVTRNGQPVETQVVIGPNFGDQSIKEYGSYQPPPQVSYAAAGSVKRLAAASIKEVSHSIQADSIAWAAVDDNYFAMALVPPNPVHATNVINPRHTEKIKGKDVERHFISVAIPVPNGQLNHVYAGPKDPETLTAVNQKFGLKPQDGNLEDLVNYGFLSFVVKPLASLMLKALLIINRFIGNYGWSIIVFTVVLNMFFFPLRWKSSVSMKRTAVMQPKMKELQERMKKLDKNDPRMAELQREQISLMREGNPLMGCLPLFLQLPFFYAVYTILTVSIEVRHAPFFGWIHDLSSPDQYWILPIVMCVSMIAQTALTPSTGDPMQKKMSYLMPVILTAVFFVNAPAGLVLYWMVGNLVGIAQQMIINRLNPPNTPATTNGSKKNSQAVSNASKSDQTQQLPKGKKSKELLTNP